MRGFTPLLATLILFYYTLCNVKADIAYHLDTFDKPSRTCEPIVVDMCKGHMGYNYTGGPNFLNQDSYTQQDSQVLLNTFQQLIQNGCSKQLKRFLCAAYVPMCDPQVKQLIGPCNSVCLNVKVSTGFLSLFAHLFSSGLYIASFLHIRNVLVGWYLHVVLVDSSFVHQIDVSCV